MESMNRTQIVTTQNEEIVQYHKQQREEIANKVLSASDGFLLIAITKEGIATIQCADAGINILKIGIAVMEWMNQTTKTLKILGEMRKEE